jgi:hypothetical protein
MLGKTQIAFLSTIIFLEGSANPPLQCEVESIDGQTTVFINVVVPHPAEMLVYTPSEQVIVLRALDIPFQHPETDDFENLGRFSLTSKSYGTVWNEWGETESAPVLGVSGTYELVIAENIETEPENTLFYSCKFDLGTDDV